MQTLHIDNQNWQQALAETVTDSKELCRILHISPQDLPLPAAELQNFPLRVPQGFLRRMERGNPRDPLLLQVLATALEAQTQPGFAADPVGDQDATLMPGVLQKYHGRVLLVVTGACAIHCRYCFRRFFPYSDNMLKPDLWRRVLNFLEKDASIEEIILSGGDPLILSDKKLANIIKDISLIPHIRRLRFHSRIPVVLPERLTPELKNILLSFNGEKVLVIHANHPRELDHSVTRALFPLREAGFHLLNQSVLLRHINDSANTLINLSNQLFKCGVQPYYLHQLDKVTGAGHFQVTDAQALVLIAQITRELPGYLVPKLVREQVGAPNKLAITHITGG